MDQIQKIKGGSLSLIKWISFELTIAITDQYRDKYRHLYPQDGKDWSWKWFNENPIEVVSEAVYEMVYSGVPKCVFHDVEIYVFPVGILKPGLGQLDIAATGVTWGSDIIWMVAHGGKSTLAHEIGHVTHSKLLNSWGPNWDLDNRMVQKYIKIKEYPVEKLLNIEEYKLVPWEGRITEWFAEDFSWYVGYRPIEQHRAGPKPTKEVQEFFDELFDKQSNISPT